jgi:hypothetical protein
MPQILFIPRFVPAVESGEKRQTIRLPRKKNPIYPGDNLILGTWTGKPYRSKVRRLREGETCLSVELIEIEDEAPHFPYRIGLKRTWLSVRDRMALARTDGFSSVRDMIDWFRENHGLPFRGVVIRW